MHELQASMIKWIVGTASGLGVAAITVMTFVLNNATPKAAPSAAFAPIIVITVPPPPAALPAIRQQAVHADKFPMQARIGARRWRGTDRGDVSGTSSDSGTTSARREYAKKLPESDKSAIMRVALPGWRNR